MCAAGRGRAGAANFFTKNLGAIGWRKNRLAHVQSDLATINVESRHDFDIVWLIRANPAMHQTDTGSIAGASVKVNPLNQGAGAIADTNDGDSDFIHAKRGTLDGGQSSGQGAIM
jgi:hypothetical protein